MPIWLGKIIAKRIIKWIKHRIDLKKLMPRLRLDCIMQRWDKEIQELLINESKQKTLLNVVKNNYL